MNSNIESSSPTNMIHLLTHHGEVIAGGLLTWFLAALGSHIPYIPMLNVLLTIFNITSLLPWLQAGVYVLAMLVSLLTLYKLLVELKWIKKKK